MKGLICGFLAATSAGLTVILLKVLLLYTDLSAFELIYQRSLAALMVVSVVLYFAGHSPFDIERESAWLASQRVLGSSLGFVLQTFALEFVPTSKAVLVVNNPFLTSALSYLLIRERSSKQDMLCFLLCTLGVALLTDPFQLFATCDSAVEETNAHRQLIGVFLAVLASLSFNVSYVALRRLRT